MKRSLKAFWVCFLLLPFLTFAQEDNYYEEDPTYKGSPMAGLKVGVNAQLVIPVNAIVRQYFSGGTGVGVFAKYIFAGKVGLGGLFNYNFLSNRAPTVGVTNSLMVYGASLEYYLNKAKITPYFGLDACRYQFSGSYNINANGSSVQASFDYVTLNGWGIAPNIGFVYDFSSRVSTYLNFKYNHIFPTAIEGFNAQLLIISGGIFYNIGEL
ncbi:MAG: hypothetical protein SFY32_17445 [Bacteroidota bacterium]|nr:hypothetical protein [Bacteroidota bacterium]